jgi:DNA polymerase-3 subunit gamma/tau
MSGLFQQDSPPEPTQDAGSGLFGDAPGGPGFAAGSATESSAAAANAAHYRVLARKYRPTRLDDLIGQAAMVRTLRNAFALGRIAHAFMLTGVRGVGKTTTARIIARALNCTGPDGTGGPTADPCGVCPDCVAILADRHPDVVEMDAASRTGVDDVREIIEATRFRPLQARTKVFVVDEVHMLSRNAFNALLKTLEEPPPHVKFIFATTDPRKVPVTVLSRCQRFDLRRVPAAELIEHFSSIARQENVAVDAGALALIARAADGSVRDGLSLLDQAIAQTDAGGRVTEDAVIAMLGLADRGLVFDLLDAVMAGSPARALEIFDGAYDRGADPGMVLQDLLDVLYTVTRLKTVRSLRDSNDLPELERDRGGKLADKLSVPVLGRAWQMLLKGVGEVETAPDRRAAAEMMLIRLCHVADLPPPGELVRRLSEGGADTGRPGAAAPSANPLPLKTGGEGKAGNPSPRLRGEGSVGGQSVALAAEVAFAEPVPASDPVPHLASFRDVAKLVSERREAMLHAHLVHSVHLVRFAAPVIELRPEPDAPRDLAARLATLLQQATGTRWTIALSPAAGEPTLAEQGRTADAARRAVAADHPMVRAILDAFPGARIDMVRDSSADAYGLPAEPSIVGEQPLAGEPDMPDVAEGEPAEGPEDADNSRWEQQG